MQDQLWLYLKTVKKPVIKAAAPSGAEISPLRPAYVAKTPPCAGTCPCGTDIRGWLTTIAQAEAYGRTNEEAYRIAWEKITERNPFPAVCGRVCPHPCEDACNRGKKDGAVAINALEQFIGDFGIATGPGAVAAPAKNAKPNDRGDRRRAGGPFLRLPTGPPRLPRHHLRGVQPAGRHAALRHSQVPPAARSAGWRNPAHSAIWASNCSATPWSARDVSLEQLRGEYKAVFVGIGAHQRRQAAHSRRRRAQRLHRHRVPEPRQQRRRGAGRAARCW